MAQQQQQQQQPANEEDLCVVCCKKARFYSIGPCDHPVCYECSTRLRVICNKLECPICRYVMQVVVFCRELRAFADVAKLRSVSQEPDNGIKFLTWDAHKAYHKLLDNQCSECGVRCRSFSLLRDHMRKEHELFYCDLCVQNLMIFPFERKCYSRTELATHRRKGDPDDTSHKGHPICKFCDERFMDNDHLYRHLRREHLYCHFCDADGKYYFFRNYEELRGHFLEDHYLCEQGLCKSDILTSVFRTDIDLKAHIATTHSKQLGRAGTRQARMLELEFNFHPRREPDEADFNHAIGDRPRGPRGAGRGIRHMDLTFEEMPQPQPGPAATPLTAADFPALAGGNDVALPGASNASLTFTSKVSRQRFTDDEFPSLGGGGGPSTSTGAVRRAPRDITITSSAGTNNRSRPLLGNGNSARSLKMNQQNFPTLHAETASGNSTVKLTVAPHPQASQPSNVSIRVNHGGANVTSSTSIQVRPKSMAEAFPALGNGSAPVVPEAKQWVAAKPKKQPEPKISKVAKAPVLPPPSIQDFPSLSRKVEKKSSSVTVPIAGDNKTKGGANNNKSEVAQNDATTAKKDKNHNQTPNQNGKNKKEKKSEQDATNANNAKNKNKNKQAKEQTGTNGLAKGDALVKKTSTLKIGTLSQSPNGTTAPPGFAVKPPPGFSAGSNLTFTNSSGQSYNIGPSDSGRAPNSEGTARAYHQPPNFQNRNAALIKQCVKLLKTQECVNEFKSYSGLFRQGNYPAEKYYEHCCAVLGDEFDALFPELLVLLPDIDKQQELYKIHRKCGSARSLEVCGTCNQVIFTFELKQHIDSHFMENHFPGLWTDGHQVGPNAWRK